VKKDPRSTTEDATRQKPQPNAKKIGDRPDKKIERIKKKSGLSFDPVYLLIFVFSFLSDLCVLCGEILAR
jgi:hypothetical protein